MGRIRTIKPEFPQSESVGKLSRDARLLFIQLWTLSDDEGRLRASSRMLASLLYPYDDDAGGLMDGWLDELEHAGMIRRYVVDGSTFLEIVNWLDHQKIDKPSKSRLPAFVDGSRAFAKPREASTTDLGPRTRTKDLGSGGVVVEREPEAEPKPPAKSLISEEAFGITTEILASMGKRSDDPLAVGSPYIVQKWLTGGMSRDAIMCGVTTAMARKKDDPPSTFKYFENAILRASAELNRPLPIVEIKPADKITVSKHAKTGTFDAAYHSVLDKLNEGFGGPAPQERLRVGEGETDARLLAHRRRQ